MLGTTNQLRILRLLLTGCLFSLITAAASAQVIHLDIEQALSRAIRSSDVLRYARLDYNYEVARYDLGLRSFLPALTLGYTQDDAVAYYAPDTHLRSITIGIDQLLYAGGSRIQQRRAIADRLRIQQREIEEMEKELRFEVVNRYVELLKIELQIQIFEENLDQARDQVAIAEEELKIGEITRLDFVDIKLVVQDLEIELAVLEQEAENYEFRLKELLGLIPTCSLELEGVINPSFRGMLPAEEEQFFIANTRNHSIELQRRAADIAAMQGAVKQAQLNWLPRVSTQLELSVAGERFPLTDPGFSLGLNLDFAAPGLPFRTGITAGSRRSEERSFGFSYTADVGENLMGWHSLRTARIALQKTETELRKAVRGMEFSVRQQLKRRTFVLENLGLEEQRLDLQAQRHSIEAIMLEVGEMTRLEYLQSGIDLAHRRVEQLSRIVSLFQLETTLMAQCGLDLWEHGYRYILLSDTDGTL
jgi:outer membrane protein TolC